MLFNKVTLLAGEGSSLAPLPFPFSNLGASPASAFSTFCHIAVFCPSIGGTVITSVFSEKMVSIRVPGIL